ncbi:MAG: DUF1638 domain-containing protein [Nitrospina sp.]|nr:DUF1638 domain-containing protein [Nitrospina sp.]
MAVIGIITCEILELEFAHLLANDSEVEGITVVEDTHSAAIIDALSPHRADGGAILRRIPYLKEFTPNHEHRMEVLVRVLELALHNRKKNLQNGLIKAAKEMGRYVDAIVLGYGLCGNALRDPDELLSDAGAPVFIPMDQDHPVDDCIGLVMGGREHYYGEQCKIAGTFFMIPGWTRHWKHLLKEEYGGFDPALMKKIFGMAKYERSLLIPNPVLSQNEMEENIAEFNELFGFRTDIRQGTLAILEDTWKSMKKHIRRDSREK